MQTLKAQTGLDYVSVCQEDLVGVVTIVYAKKGFN